MTTKLASTEFLEALGASTPGDAINEVAAGMEQEKREKMIHLLQEQLQRVAIDLADADVTDVAQMVKLQSEAKAITFQLNHFESKTKGVSYVTQ